MASQTAQRASPKIQVASGAESLLPSPSLGTAAGELAEQYQGVLVGLSRCVGQCRAGAVDRGVEDGGLGQVGSVGDDAGHRLFIEWVDDRQGRGGEDSIGAAKCDSQVVPRPQ